MEKNFKNYLMEADIIKSDDLKKDGVSEIEQIQLDVDKKDGNNIQVKYIPGLNQPQKNSISIPDSEKYWIDKGKIGKKCMIYLHDDLDGIFSAIIMKQYLRQHGFEIVGYGVVNYTDSWRYVDIDTKYINVCVDFANDNAALDIYIDHHGNFDDKSPRLSQVSSKTNTSSAYEGICKKLGLVTDPLALQVIDMIDAAKYSNYNVDISKTLEFEMKDFKNRLEFAGAFNQLIKRSDFTTIIGVVHNCNLSIINIFTGFKILYPINNYDKKTGDPKEFVDDGKKRIDQMMWRSGGSVGRYKKVYWYQRHFMRDFVRYDQKTDSDKIMLDGFQMIGNLAFFPSGTWANPIRARALLQMYEIEEKVNIKYIMLQYGNSLQIVGYEPLKDIFAVGYAFGDEVRDLDKYTTQLLHYFMARYGYTYQKTLSGGHPNIGNISNIFGVCNRICDKKYDCVGVKFLDMFKNRIINDLSGVKWELDTSWGASKSTETKEMEMNFRVIMVDQIDEIW